MTTYRVESEVTVYDADHPGYPHVRVWTTDKLHIATGTRASYIALVSGQDEFTIPVDRWPDIKRMVDHAIDLAQGRRGS